MKWLKIFMGISSLLLLTGCGWIPMEEEIKSITIAKSKEEVDYTLDLVQRGDLVSMKSITCTYTQLKEEKIYFRQDGKRVKEVYVSEGDQVKKGTLLAELETGDLENQIREVTYKLEKMQLEYALLLEKKELELLFAEELFFYTTMNDSERKKTEDQLAEITKTYEPIEEDYEDQIYLAQEKKKRFEEELETSRVYAGMDGMVYYVRTKLVGSLSNTEIDVMLLVDDSQCAFFSENMEYSTYFEEGQIYQMKAGYGSKEVQLEIVATDVSGWTDRMRFDLVDQNEVVEFQTRGTFDLILEEKVDVLYVSQNSIHKADGKTYVYTLSEDGMRDVRYVTCGLTGNGKVEIISGLSEDELVIMK